MELKQLEYFVTAAEELNFTRAAKRCHVVQSAISASIKALERELGTELFDRTTHRVRLTDDGGTFLDKAREVLRAADVAQTSLTGPSGTLRGRLAVGVMQGAWNGMPEAIRVMKSRHPGVRIQLRQAPVGDLLRGVLESSLDVAVVPLSRQSRPGLRTRELYREDFVLVVPVADTLAAGHAVGLGAVAERELVAFTRAWALQAVIDRGFDHAGVVPAQSFEVNDITVGLDIVRAGLAVMILPRHVAPQGDGVATVELADQLGWRIGVTSSSRTCTPAASAFIEITAAMSDAISAEPS